ncbi:MAG: helix-turn-helix transcriptional regulator [Deltaproteobacteria bacterium]|nr:helix-turn-helix transcriptional regulator [Deltaproteobacteria bacterium]
MKKPSPPPDSYFNRTMLIYYRRRKQFTQEALAKELTLVRGGYAGYEAENVVPSLHVFRQLCLCLDLNPLEIADLLRLTPLSIDHTTRQRFPKGCKLKQMTETHVLCDLIMAYIKNCGTRKRAHA